MGLLMNFLAHMYLSGYESDIIAGNFAADFLRTSQTRLLPEGIMQGIYLHRKIDAFTDSHEKFRESVALLRPTQGKYAPVTTDILYDHYLSHNWDDFSQEPLEIFSNRIYKALDEQASHFPDKLRNIITRMIEDDFLLSCKSETRLYTTFERLGRRARFPNAFHRAIDDLNHHYPAFEMHFRHFLPAISNFISKPQQYS
jgi:acyl carrier protein phosphodiesterase